MADIVVMVVTDALGGFTDLDEEENAIDKRGTCCPVVESAQEGGAAWTNPYKFYARAPWAAASEVAQVALVMPVGGAEAGLYRFPRIGEQVLVAVDTTGENVSRYLLGYLPTAGDYQGTAQKNLPGVMPFQLKKSESTGEGSTSLDAYDTTKTEVLDKRGQVFRYRQTGKTEEEAGAGERYSEIGFYHEKTSWKPKSADAEKYADTDAGGYPGVDRLRIKSTGDIREEAANWRLSKARRVEFLAGVEETDHTDANALPPLDKPGDDSRLNAGDFQVRAKNRIVLKAGEQIVIEVGRSSIIIDDKGISLTSRKTDSGIINSWDTVLNLTALKGIVGFGNHVFLQGGVDFVLSEGYGGIIQSCLGLLRINGVDIKAETTNALNYIPFGIINGVDFLQNCVTLPAGDASAKWMANEMVGSLLGLGPFIRLASPGISSGLAPAVPRSTDDSYGALVGVIQIIIVIMSILAPALEVLVPEGMNARRDGIYSALALAEYAALLAAFSSMAMTILGGGFPIWNASLWLHTEGKLILEALDESHYFCSQEADAAPLAAVKDMSSLKDEAKQTISGALTALKENWVKVLGGGLAALGVGGATVGATLGAKTFEKNAAYNAAIKEELESL